ncbi:MAG: sulfatase-like hydrolase/transferase [Planctomycetes bacterium]|nr:sulfatase-like hydrolase/transferase [Planctomycetota bacterium]
MGDKGWRARPISATALRAALLLIALAWAGSPAGCVSGAPESRATDQPVAAPGTGEPAAAVTPAVPRPKRVILISFDTLRPDHVHGLGYERETTPHLDAFAREAVTFTTAVSQSSWSLPSHASLFTSQYVERHGASMRTPLADGAVTLAEVLAACGYETAAFTGDFHVGAEYGLAQGFTIYDDDTPFAPFAHTVPLARRWLAQRRERPTFLFLHGYDAHAPYQVPSPDDRRFDPEYAGFLNQVTLDHELGDILSSGLPRAAVPGAGAGAGGGEGGGSGNRDGRTRGDRWATEAYTERDQRHLIARYDGAIHWADQQLGGFFAFLKSEGLFDDSLIAVVSDHGETLGDHGQVLARMHGGVYEEGIRVFCALRIPRAARAGDRVATPVGLIDVAPTILDALGVPAPAEFQGRSLLPWYAGRAGKTDEVRPCQFSTMTPGRDAVRGSRWKLIDLPGERMLFDLTTDPEERRDVAEEHPDVVREMESRLDEWRESNRRDPLAPAPEAEEDDATEDDVSRRLSRAGYWWLSRSFPANTGRRVRLGRGAFFSERDGLMIGGEALYRWDGVFWRLARREAGERFRRVEVEPGGRPDRPAYRVLGAQGFLVFQDDRWRRESPAWLPTGARDFRVLPATAAGEARRLLAAGDVLLAVTGSTVAASQSFPGAGFHTLHVRDGSFAVALGEKGAFATWDGAEWTRVDAPAPYRLNDAAFAAGGVVVVVGDHGTLLDFAGGRFTRHPMMAPVPYEGVVAFPDGRRWAGGGYGTLLSFTNGAWKREPRGTAEDVAFLAADPSGRLWAFGKEGDILRREGERWSSQWEEVWHGGRTPVAAARAPSGARWAVDASGKFLRFTPGGGGETGGAPARWSATGFVAERAIRDIAFAPDGRGYAVGKSLLALRLASPSGGASGAESAKAAPPGQGSGEWVAAPVPLIAGAPASPRPTLNGVAFSPDGEAWVVGDRGLVLREEAGGQFRVVETPVKNDLAAIAFSSDGKGWAVGAGGAILRWMGSRFERVVFPLPPPPPPPVADLAWVVAVDNRTAYAGGARCLLRCAEGTWSHVLARPSLEAASPVGPPGTVGAPRQGPDMPGAGAGVGVGDAPFGTARPLFRGPESGFLASGGGRLIRFERGEMTLLPEIPPPAERAALDGRWRPRIAALLAADDGALEIVVRNGGFVHRWDGARWEAVVP